MWTCPIFKCWELRKFRKHCPGQTKHIYGLCLACWLPVCDFSSKTLMDQMFSKEGTVKNGPLGQGKKLLVVLFILFFKISSLKNSYLCECCIIYITDSCIAHVYSNNYFNKYYFYWNNNRHYFNIYWIFKYLLLLYFNI